MIKNALFLTLKYRKIDQIIDLLIPKFNILNKNILTLKILRNAIIEDINTCNSYLNTIYFPDENVKIDFGLPYTLPLLLFFPPIFNIIHNYLPPIIGNDIYIKYENTGIYMSMIL